MKSNGDSDKPIDPIFAMRKVLEDHIASDKSIPFRNDVCEKMMTDFIQAVLPPGQKKIYNRLKDGISYNPRELCKRLNAGSKRTRVPVMQLAVKGLVETWRSSEGYFIVKKNPPWQSK